MDLLKPQLLILLGVYVGEKLLGHVVILRLTVGWKVLYVLLSSFGWNVLFIWSKVWFKLNIFLFIFCLYDLSIVILGY